MSSGAIKKLSNDILVSGVLGGIMLYQFVNGMLMSVAEQI